MGKLRKYWKLFAFLLGIFYACSSTISPVSAQDDDEGVFAGAVRFPAGERSFRQDLRRASEAIEEKRNDEALSLLGRLLTGDPAKAKDDESSVLTEDYFLIGKDRVTLTSLKGEALRLLDSIPPNQRASYELEHGTEAKSLLDRAIREGDAERVAEVVRRFFHTEAGYRACLVLGRLHLEQGRPHAAASYLKQVVGNQAAAKFVEPEASVLLAAAQLHSGDRAEAEQTLLALKQRMPEFSFRNGNTPAFRSEADALGWLEKLFGRPQAAAGPTALQWTMFRGGADRNAATTISEPASLPRWQVPVANDMRDEDLIAERARSMQQQGVPSIPSIQPLAVQNVVVMRGPDRLIAVDMKTGKRIWVFPWTEITAPPDSRGSQAAASATRSKQLEQRVWDDAPYGQLSSDGEYVYFVGDLGDSAPYGGAPLAMFDPRGRISRNPLAASSHNKLYALSLQKQGKLMWDSPAHGDDPLDEAFFLGAPLPVNGQLFAIAELRGEIALLAIDPRSGELKWKQQLAHVENFNVLSDPIRRLAGASPSFADGVVVCPTSTGAVIAVDVATRRLLWGMTYSRGENRSGRFDNPYVPRNIAKYGDRWLDSTATIIDGKVILTPPDSSEIHCLELTTGKAVWPAQRREDLLYVAGVKQGNIILVGKKQVVGIKLSDGTRAWPEVAIDLPSGRGLLDQKHLFQPTATGKLVVIDIATGETKSTFETSKPLGNLVAYGDDIVSVSDSLLAAYPRVDRLQAKISAALEKNPKDAWAIARQSELLMHEHKWQEALARLRESYATSDYDPAVPQLLVECMLALLEKDFEANRSLIAEIDKLADDPAVRDRFHRLVAQGYEKSGERLAAFRSLLAIEAASPHDSGETLRGREVLTPVTPAWLVTSNRWVAGRLVAIYEKASQEEQKEMDGLVRAEQERLSKASAAALTKFTERFAFHPAAREVRLDLANVLADSGNLLGAESIARDLLHDANRTVAGRALKIHAQVQALAQRWPQAIASYEALGKNFAGIEVEAGKTGQQLHDEVAKRFEYRRAKESSTDSYPNGKVVADADSRTANQGQFDQRRVYPITLLQADVPHGLPVTPIYDNLQNTLRVRDARGKDVLLVSLNRTDNRRFYANSAMLYSARLAGNLLIVSTAQEVIAIDLLRTGHDPEEVIVWRRDFVDVSEQGVYNMVQTRSLGNPWASPRTIATDTNGRPLGVMSPITSAGVCFFQQKSLLCVDPVTGKTIWQRDDVAAGADLFGDEEYLFVAPHNSEEAQVYRMVDGSHVGTRPIPGSERRWATSGRRVLSWWQDGKGLGLKLDDILTQQNVWTERAPSGSKAWLNSPEEVAILRADGDFKIRSLLSGAMKLEAKLEPERDLQQLYVLKGRESYFVAVGVSTTNPIAGSIVHAGPISGSVNWPLITGKLYAIDIQSGKPAWPAPATISQYGLPLEQPLDQPILFFVRRMMPKSGPSAVQKTTSSVLCLDKRTGALIYEQGQIPGEPVSYEVEAEADGRTVRVAVPGKSVLLRFTEEPAAPEPPYQNDEGFMAPGSKGIGSAVIRSVTNPFDLFDP